MRSWLGGPSVAGSARPGGLGEFLLLAQDKPAPGGRWNWLKYGVWLPWLALIGVAFGYAGGIQSIDPLFMTTHGVSAAGIEGYIVNYAVALLIAALALAMGRRAFCHYACWMAPFMIIGSRLGRAARLPALHLRSDATQCINCKRCSRACSMSLDVHAMVRDGQTAHDECILCGACADACPKDALKLAFGRPLR